MLDVHYLNKQSHPLATRETEPVIESIYLIKLMAISDEFDLIINTKYNIFAAKKHRKIDETMDLK